MVIPTLCLGLKGHPERMSQDSSGPILLTTEFVYVYICTAPEITGHLICSGSCAYTIAKGLNFAITH